MIKTTLLGTAAMAPTRERNVAAIHITYNGEGILFDCGEGTQRQMIHADLNRNDVKKIFITHWHADHVGGLLPLIQTLSDPKREVHLDIYGPIETKERLQHFIDATYFDNSIKIAVHEIKPTQKVVVAFECDSYRVEAISLDHAIPTIGYSFVEQDRRRMKVAAAEKLGIKPGPIMAKFQAGEDAKVDGKLIKADDVTYIVAGKRITYLSDTAMCGAAIDLAKNSDLLICESTYASNEEEKAAEHKHMTSAQAAQIAAMSESQQLILTHISQRYKSTEQLLADAKDVFTDTQLGFDLMQIKL